MTNSVSVIIPNYNYGRFLRTTIDSVLSQSHKHLEVIVIDNGSTDNSRDVLESYGQKIRTILQENQGQASARNNGIAIATGNLVALLDADDYWEETKLEEQLECISEDVQFVYTGMRRFASDTGAVIDSVMPWFGGDCRQAFVEYPSRAIVPGGESSAIFSRELIEKTGKFDLTLNSASGRDFFRRCSRHTKFGFVPKELVNIRIHGANMSENSRKMMDDTARAYDLLFSDEEWRSYRSQRRECLTKLQWSFLKTNLRNRKFLESLANLSRMVNP